MNSTPSDWSDLRSVRNWINRNAHADPDGYERPILAAFWPKLLGAFGFVLSVRFALSLSQTLVFQFMTGAVSLYFFTRLLKKLKPRLKVNKAQLQLVFQESGLQPLFFCVLAELFRARTFRGQDFPLQQNALLVLVLVWVQSFGPVPRETDFHWIAAELFMGLLFFLLRWWEEFREESSQWLAAEKAVTAFLTETSFNNLNDHFNGYSCRSCRSND